MGDRTCSKDKTVSNLVGVAPGFLRKVGISGCMENTKELQLSVHAYL